MEDNQTQQSIPDIDTSPATGTESPMNRSRISRIEEKRTRKQFVLVVSLPEVGYSDHYLVLIGS